MVTGNRMATRDTCLVVCDDLEKTDFQSAVCMEPWQNLWYLSLGPCSVLGQTCRCCTTVSVCVHDAAEQK